MVKSTTPAHVETYAGIDYHKKFSVVTLGDKDGKVLKTERVPNDRQSVTQFFQQFPGLICTVESCRGYEWFVELLQSMGLTVHLCHPYAVKLISQSRCKTDKIDSKILMELLAKGFLPTCYQPTSDERALRERLRWRMQLMRNGTRIKVRIHCLLDKENLGVVGSQLFDGRGRKHLSEVKLASPTRRQLLTEHIQLLNYLEKMLKKTDAELEDFAKQSDGAKLLMTIPGVGPLSALVIMAELGDVKRFKRSAQVVAFAGLAPSIYSSAEVRHTGAITKQGSIWLRWILIQNAWQAIRCNVPLRYHFVSVSRRCGRYAAVVAVARKLLEIAYRILRDGKAFDPNLVGPNKQST
jgi:transposase